MSSSLDCAVGNELSLHGRLLWTAATPAAALLLLLLHSVYVGMPEGGFRLRLAKSLLIWQNTFYPGLCAALATYLPCVSVSHSLHLLAHEPTTECKWEGWDIFSGFAPPLYIVIAGAGIFLLILTGPLLLFVTVNRVSSETLRTHLRFLVAGYKDDTQWWESTVLARKMLLAFIGAKVPMSYSPGRFAVWIMATAFAALGANTAFRPYSDKEVGHVERWALTASIVSSIFVLTATTAWWEEELFWFVSFMLLVGTTLSAATLYLFNPVGEGLFRERGGND